MRRRTLRFRITATFVLAAAILVGVLSVVSLVTVRRFLEDQRVRSSTRQTLFAVLYAREFLRSRSEVGELVSNLQVRQNFDAMVTTGDDWFSTGLDLVPDAIPRGLGSLVADQRVGYEVVTQRGDRRLVYGAPLPPRGVDLYLFFPMDDIDRTMSLLTRVLAATGAGVVGVAALFARRVTARILHPLGAVSQAARRMAEGLLETRVEPLSADELGQLASSFNQLGDAVHSMIQRERQFVAAVSHELRTPLAALQAGSELMTRFRSELPAEGREALDLIDEDLTALRRLVEDLMEISELDARRPALRAEEVELRTFVESVLRRMHRDAPIEGDAVVTTDKARLARIVGNLLDNAFTHGEANDVRVRLAEENGECVMTVSDRGPGISVEDQPYLFDRFYKTDRSRSRDRGGVGLGLALARENARVLGGTLTVSSHPPRGASFILRLPIRPSRTS